MYLDDRKKKILSAIVSAYIETGEPIGSKALIDREKLSLSSATIRNEMSDLERLGYLKKTHTSSGRIPSNQGYRFYVSTLQPYHLTEREQVVLNGAFSACTTVEDLLETATHRLAAFSGCTVFGLSPHGEEKIYQFEVVPAGKKKFAVMLISKTGAVRTFGYRSEQDATPEDAKKLTNILNTTLSGCTPEQVGPLRIILLEHEIKANCPQHIALIEPVKTMLKQTQEYELHIGGTENLLNYSEFSDIETARGFIGMLSKHEKILEALLEKKPSDSIEIRIGAENGIFNSPHASLITIFSENKFPVLLGLMGPTRMDYARTIAGCNHFLEHLNTYLDREY